MIRLAFHILVAIAAPACVAARPAALAVPQENRPAGGDAANHAAREEATKPELSDEARETIELVRSALQANDREAARELLREAVAVLEDPEPGQEPSHIAFLLELDGMADQLGSLEESRRLCEIVMRLSETLLPPDHPDLLRAKVNLATTRAELGDLAGARALEEEVLEARTRLLPPDHPDLLGAKGNLAATMAELGDLAGARALEEEVLEARTRLLPPDHPDLLSAKVNLAATRYALGDITGARALEEEVLEARTRLLPPDHPDLLGAKGNLAVTMAELGDLAGARALEEEVLEAWTRLLPLDHPDPLAAKLNLAATMADLGDLAGARALKEEVLEARIHLLPPDHPDLLRAKENLAATRYALGDLGGARALEEEVLEAWTRLLPLDHPDLLAAKLNLAMTRKALGDLDDAHALEEDVLATRTRVLPPDHPDLLKTKESLAATRYALGDLYGARALFEEVLAAEIRLLPPDHPGLLRAKLNLAVTRAELGDLASAHTLVSSLLEGIRLRAEALRSEAVRPAREGARGELLRLFDALLLSGATDPEDTLHAELFATLENLRLASVASSEVAQALSEHPELAEGAGEIAALRSRLANLVAAGAGEGSSLEDWRKELLQLAGERDRAEHELRAKLAESGVFVAEVVAASVGAKVPPDAVAVSYLRYPNWLDKDPGTGETPPSVDSLLAFLVRPGGAVRRVELGPAAELDELVADWREALGRPLAGRGVGVAEAARGEEALETLGRRLRERVLDPVLAGAGEVRTVHVVLDDLLHLVPLDALPLGTGLVGDRVAVRIEITFARLLRADDVVGSEGALTLAGGIDYDAELGAEALVRLDAGTPPVAAGSERSAPGMSSFAVLHWTSVETDSIAALYRESFEREASVLTKARATKAALFAAAPSTRWLHLATHGWFAPESFRSQLDTLAERGAREPWQRAEETLTGFAPETLCGLALAGANRGRDAFGRVPGILTAEELATFDLRNCELAVLSACETNVGIRRAGQGIQSLQAALHAAGARTAITSLWKVDDAATRRLFELFYTKLWKERLGKADALWQAKMALRAEGHPLRDWAGWVLTGDPD